MQVLFFSKPNKINPNKKNKNPQKYSINYFGRQKVWKLLLSFYMIISVLCLAHLSLDVSSDSFRLCLTDCPTELIQSHRCPRLIRHMKIQRPQQHTTKESPCVYPFTQSYRLSRNSYNSYVMTVTDWKISREGKERRKEGRKKEQKEARKVLT